MLYTYLSYKLAIVKCSYLPLFLPFSMNILLFSQPNYCLFWSLVKVSLAHPHYTGREQATIDKQVATETLLPRSLKHLLSDPFTEKKISVLF